MIILKLYEVAVKGLAAARGQTTNTVLIEYDICNCQKFTNKNIMDKTLL